MSAKFVTGVCRASYAFVFEPRQEDTDDGQGKSVYSLSLLIPKSDAQTVAKIKAAQKAAVENKWPNKTPSGLDLGLRDGDDPDVQDRQGAPYADHWYITAKSFTNKPSIIDTAGAPVTDPTVFVSGDYCRASVRAYGYHVKGNKGVAWGLGNLQFVKRGEPLGSITRAEDDFAEFLEPAEQKADMGFLD